MRLKHLIAVAAFALVGGAAHADITLTIDPLGPLTPGNNYTVTGTITNNDLADGVGIDGTTTPPSPPINLVSDDFLNYLLGTATGEQDIAPGGSFSHALYTFTASTPNDLITYGVSGFDLVTGASVSANAVGTAVPEPGSIAMLVGGAFGSGLFLLRRRRK